MIWEPTATWRPSASSLTRWDTPQLTGNRRIDARITDRAALMGHGTREQRLANFRAGYDRGAGACLSELAS